MAKVFTNTIFYNQAQKVLAGISDEKRLFKLVLNNSKIKNMVIELNTEDQLYSKGIDSLGNSLGLYSEITISIKRSKGQPTDRVTLKDTGDFYDTFKVDVREGEIVITANTIKDQDDLIQKYGSDIIGLTDDNLQKLIIFAKGLYIDYLLKLWRT